MEPGPSELAIVFTSFVDCVMLTQAAMVRLLLAKVKLAGAKDVAWSPSTGTLPSDTPMPCFAETNSSPSLSTQLTALPYWLKSFITVLSSPAVLTLLSGAQRRVEPLMKETFVLFHSQVSSVRLPVLLWMETLMTALLTVALSAGVWPVKLMLLREGSTM